MKRAKPLLDEMFRHFSDVDSCALWIEPTTNAATGRGGLLSHVFRLFKDTQLSRFGQLDVHATPEAPAFTSEAKFHLALGGLSPARVRLSVMPIDLSSRTGGH
jgi:hypothetical protein